MNKYIVQAHAQWTKWCEHPAGKMPDIKEPGSRKLNCTFNAENITEARKAAAEHYDKFREELPKEKTGGLSGTYGLRVGDPIFAKVYPL